MNVIAFSEPCGPFCNPHSFQEFLDDGGMKLLIACIKENGGGLDFSELLHELMITASKCIARYDDRRVDAKLTTFVWKCCENTIKMAHRKKHSKESQAMAAVASLEDVGEQSASTDLEDDVLERLEHERRVQLLYAVIDDPNVLNEEERIVVKLTLGGYSQTEIGRVIGTVQSEVSKRYTSAKVKLGPALLAAGI